MPTSLTCPSCLHAIVWSEPGGPPQRCPACEALLAPAPEAATTQTHGNHEGVGTDPYAAPGVAGGTAPAAPPLPPGSLVGRTVAGYEVLGELGRGGMGVVFKARQVALNRIVALKVIRAAGLASDEARGRFRTEAMAAARLQHPNIVTVHEIGEWDGAPFFSLEYLAGGSLAKVLGTSPQPPGTSAALVEALARAMHYAHSRGVVHRDLKPANVLVPGADEAGAQSARDTSRGAAEKTGGPGQGSAPASSPSRPSSSASTQTGWAAGVKITDFGLAKHLEDESPGQTQTGQVMGTPSYMAPEQARGQKDVGPPADIYALGAILYQCLTGRPPFKGATGRETIEQVLHAEPVAPRRLVPHLAIDLDTICLKCLEKEPGRRYPTAEALADDLRRFLDGEPIKARPVGALGRAVKWARRQPVQAGLLGLIAGLVLLFAVLVTSQWLRAEEAAARAGDEAERARVEKASADVASQLAEQRRLLAEKETDRANRSAAEAKRQQDRAVRSAALAKQEAARAERALHAAREEEKKARAAQAREQEQRQLADQRRGLAERAEAQARRALATSRVGQAHEAFAENNLKLAADLLDGVAHEARFWDWHLMRRLTEGGPVSLPGVGRVHAFSPDGRYVAGLSGEALVLMDLHEKAKVTRLVGHSKAVTGLVFTLDGKTLLSSSRDGTVRLWSVSSGKETGRFAGHTGAVGAVAISPDGQRAASAGDKVRLWGVASQREEKALAGPLTATRGLAFSPDGKLIAWGGDPTPGGRAGALGGLRAWDVATGTELTSLAPFSRWGIRALAFHPEDGRLAFSSTFSSKVIDPRSGKEVGARPEKEGGAIRVSPDGRLWAVVGSGVIHLVEVATGRVVRSVPVRQLTSYELGFTPDARFLTVSRDYDDGEEERIDCWPTRGPLEGMHLRHSNHTPHGMAFSPDSRRLITSGRGPAVIWDTRTGAVLRTLEGASGLVAWSRDGRWIATGGAPVWAGVKATVTLWDATTFKAVRALEGATGEVASLAFSPDSNLLAAGSGGVDEGHLTVWEAPTGKKRFSVAVASVTVNKLAWSPEGTFLVTAGLMDRFLRYTDALTGKLMQRIEPHAGGVGGIAYSPSGEWLATSGAPVAFSRLGEVKIYDRKLGRELRVLRGHSNTVWGLGWGGRGERLASGALDNTIKLWDPTNGLDALTLRTPGLNLVSLAFSPDGHFLAASGFGSVYLFDGRPVVERVALKTQPQSSSWAAAGPDGRWVLSKDEIGNLVARDPRSGRVLWSLEVKGRSEPVIAAHVDARRVAVVAGQEVVERDALTGVVTRTFTGPAHPVWRLAYSADGKSLAAVSGGVTAGRQPASVRVVVWDAETGKERHRFTGPEPVGFGLGLVLTPDLDRVGILVAGAREENKRKLSGYRVWALESGKELAVAAELDGAREVSWRRQGRRTSPARLGRGVMRGSDETTRVIDVPDDEAEVAAARLLPQPHWHEAEAKAAFASRRWFEAVHHLGRARLSASRRSAEAEYQLGAALHNYGQMLRDQGQHTLGLKAVRRAVPIYERLVREHPKRHEYRRDMANTLVYLAHLEELEGRLTEAVKLTRRGIKEFEAASAAAPQLARYRGDVVYGRRSLADFLKMSKKLAEAEKEYLAAIAVGRKLLEDHPGELNGAYNLSAVCHNLADLYQELEQNDKAVKYWREARGLLEMVARPGSPSYVQRDLCNTLMALGQALRDKGQFDDGLTAVEAAIKRMRALADRPGASHEVRGDCAEMVGRYANILSGGPHPEKAEEHYEEALRRARGLLRDSDDQPTVRYHYSAILHNYANYMITKSRRAFAAEVLYREAEAVLKKLVEDGRGQPLYRRDLANTRMLFGRALASAGKRLPAQTMLRQAEKDWSVLAATYKDVPEYALNAASARAEMALLRGRTEAAAREAEALVQAKDKRARDAYSAAVILARCAEQAAKAPAADEAKRKAEAERYASRAVQLLAQALREYKSAADRARGDNDLAPLRGREDYKKLFVEKKD